MRMVNCGGGHETRMRITCAAEQGEVRNGEKEETTEGVLQDIPVNIGKDSSGTK